DSERDRQEAYVVGPGGRARSTLIGGDDARRCAHLVPALQRGSARM
ncbi:MAG: hypothetical protein AVDCRST_MAG69-1903, partial [uncultured Solirubrobacteraceae bacterium]